jgi:hypothetical protein
MRKNRGRLPNARITHATDYQGLIAGHAIVSYTHVKIHILGVCIREYGIVLGAK